MGGHVRALCAGAPQLWVRAWAVGVPEPPLREAGVGGAVPQILSARSASGSRLCGSRRKLIQTNSNANVKPPMPRTLAALNVKESPAPAVWLWLVEGTGLGCTSRSWAEGHRQAQTRRETISGRWGDDASGEKEGPKLGEVWPPGAVFARALPPSPGLWTMMSGSAAFTQKVGADGCKVTSDPEWPDQNLNSLP